MTLHKSSGLLFLLGLLATSSAGAIPVSPAMVSVNGGAYVAIPLEDGGKPSYFCAGTSGCSSGAITGAGYSIQVDVVMDPDPSIDYGIAVTNTSGGVLNFSFMFGQAIVLTPAPGSVNTSMSGSTTNGGGSPGVVTVTPLAPPFARPVDSDGIPELQAFQLSTDGGASFLNAGIDLGPAFSSNPALTSDSYGPFNSAVIPGPAGTGSYNYMLVDLNFSLTGGGDIFTFNGSAVVTPEPDVAALVSLGLVALGYAGRRRRSA